MQRRTFLALGGLLAAAGTFGGWTLVQRQTTPLLLSARNDADGNHYAVGYHLDGRKAFSTRITERCHDVVPHPSLPLAVFVGRRPSRESYLIDTRDGRLLQTLISPEHRHFYGHGVFHADGEWFYSTENDTADPGRGVLGVYRLQSNSRLQRVAEHPTHGIGPHQLLWMPDSETLAVANGGIRTEADSRAMLNLDNMKPSLVLMGRDGSLISKEQLAEPMNSVRHMAVASDGTLVTGQQYEGDPEHAVPLLAIKRPGQPFQAFPLGEAQRRAMRQYTASVAIHSELRRLAVTAPRGNRFYIWDLDSAELLLDAPLPDCAGVAASRDGFVVSAGVGRCRHYACRGGRIVSDYLELPAGLWDNHLRLA